MTTKTRSKKKVEVVEDNPKLFREMNFQLSELPGCCGICVVNGFQDEDEYTYTGGGWNYDARRKKVPFKYGTKEEQAEACYKKFLDRTLFEAEYGDMYSTLVVSLVTKYADHPQGKEAQYPEMAAILEREGWKENERFINPNHENEVTMWSKHFPERVQQILDHDND